MPNVICKRRILMTDISRRNLIKVTGAVGVTMLPLVTEPASAAAEHTHEHNRPEPEAARTAASASSAEAAATPPTYLFFNSEEAAFIEAAVARLIPKDEQWDGALEVGASQYMDKQLAGAWGAGERLYREFRAKAISFHTRRLNSSGRRWVRSTSRWRRRHLCK